MKIDTHPSEPSADTCASTNLLRLMAAKPAVQKLLLVLLLATLHGALLAAKGAGYQKAWLICHMGLFLLWQPFFGTDRKLRITGAAMVSILVALGVFQFAGWVLVVWISLLIAIFGGKVITNSRRDWHYLTAVFYLLMVLLIWAVPVHLLSVPGIPLAFGPLMTLGAPALFLIMIFTPSQVTGSGQAPAQAAHIFDFFYAVMVFQLVLVIVLGTIALMSTANDDYFSAVAKTVLFFGLGLASLALLWNPRRIVGGFTGLRTYFSRYLLSVGMPFEVWMRQVAEFAESARGPEDFLRDAMDALAQFPWIAGGKWRSDAFDNTANNTENQFGRMTDFHTSLPSGNVEITIYTDAPLSPALHLHLRLLAQVIGEFFVSKVRERELKQNAYLQAVHETGARVTHDVKNLLQSIQTLTQAAPAATSVGTNIEREQAYLVLLQKHLPQLAKRLELTLNALSKPAERFVSIPVNAMHWWQNIQARNFPCPVYFRGDVQSAMLIDAPLFDSVVENCINNISKLGTEYEVTIELLDHNGEIGLSISNNGPAVAADIAARITREPLPGVTNNSFGVGLYQVRKLALTHGYDFRLQQNRDGYVLFTLQKLTRSNMAV